MDKKVYTLRGLTADDIFPMFKIISNIGLKEFKSCFDSDAVQAAIKAGENGAEIDMSAVGVTVAVDIAAIIFANLPKCKDDIYQLLSGLSGMSKKEIAALPMNVFLSMVIDVIKKEEFRDFFQDVSRLFK